MSIKKCIYKNAVGTEIVCSVGNNIQLVSENCVEFGVCDNNYASLLQYCRHYVLETLLIITTPVWLVSINVQHSVAQTRNV